MDYDMLVRDLGYHPDSVEVQFWLDGPGPAHTSYHVPLRDGGILILRGDTDADIE